MSGYAVKLPAERAVQPSTSAVAELSHANTQALVGDFGKLLHDIGIYALVEKDHDLRMRYAPDPMAGTGIHVRIAKSGDKEAVSILAANEGIEELPQLKLIKSADLEAIRILAANPSVTKLAQRRILELNDPEATEALKANPSAIRAVRRA